MNVQEPHSPSSLVTTTLESGKQTAWFVGGVHNDTGDQTARFVAQGIWENGSDNRYLELVRSMRPGDRIAIRSCHVRKHGLPFDNRGLPVSVMAIKAIGTVLENLNDGRRVRVEWTPVTPAREWYFYTYPAAVWRVHAGYWMPDGLIKFAFDGVAQDIAQFCNAPYWRERFGTQAPGAEHFGWSKFYEAIADKLLAYRDNRGPLLEC